jgi:photosystem II stability/assembly factor-like uncharacterized protein
MRNLIVLFILLSVTCSSQTEKRILFQSDSTWYAAFDQLLFSSTNKGISWDTIFAKRNPTDTVFFNGPLDTATNVFIPDAKTLFVFGWDGTMHYKTILYSSTDGGKTWNKSWFYTNAGNVGVKYMHKVSASYFIMDRRQGQYSVTEDAGKTWKNKCVMTDKFSCADERLTFHQNGDITYQYSRGQECRFKRVMVSRDNGKTWVNDSKVYPIH